MQKIGKEIGIEFISSVDQGWSDEQPEPPPTDEERIDKYGNAMKLYCEADKIKQALLSIKLVEGTARMMKHYPDGQVETVVFGHDRDVIHVPESVAARQHAMSLDDDESGNNADMQSESDAEPQREK